jgi:Glucosidase II beta subunit-like protein
LVPRLSNGKAWAAADSSGNQFSWHICSENKGLQGCSASAACQQPASGDAKSCGKLNTQEWAVSGDDNGDTATILYKEGTQCKDGTPRQTTITLKCVDQPTAIVGSVAEDPANACFYLVTMQGKELCGSGANQLPSPRCKFVTPAGFEYDFANVDTNHSRAWTAVDKAGNFFAWHLCSVVRSDPGCVNSAVCQGPIGSDVSCGIVASQQLSVLGADDGQGVTVRYSHGTTCRNGVGRSTTMELVCGANSTVSVRVDENPSQPCNYTIRMEGEQFCPTNLSSTPSNRCRYTSPAGFLFDLSAVDTEYVILHTQVPPPPLLLLLFF